MAPPSQRRQAEPGAVDSVPSIRRQGEGCATGDRHSGSDGQERCTVALYRAEEMMQRLDGGVLGVKAITGEGCEIIDQPLDIGNAVRPVGMAGDLHLLPRRQAGIGLLQQPVGLALKLTHLVGDIDLACIREMAKLFDFAFQLRDRPFEIKKGLHAVNRPIPFAGAFLT